MRKVVYHTVGFKLTLDGVKLHALVLTALDNKVLLRSENSQVIVEAALNKLNKILCGDRCGIVVDFKHDFAKALKLHLNVGKLGHRGDNRADNNTEYDNRGYYQGDEKLHIFLKEAGRFNNLGLTDGVFIVRIFLLCLAHFSFSLKIF